MVVMTNINNGLVKEGVNMLNIVNLQQRNISHNVVDSNDLPIYCSFKDAKQLNMHPKVYMQFNEQGSAVCPYCGLKYELI